MAAVVAVLKVVGLVVTRIVRFISSVSLPSVHCLSFDIGLCTSLI